MNRLLLTAIGFISYMIMSGLLTQIGVILNAVSSSLNATPAATVGVFSWLTGGALCGTFASLFLYARHSLKQVLIANYTLFLAIMLVLVVVAPTSYWPLAIVLWGLGVGCGCGLAGGAVILSKIYHEAKRASAFLATDCAFSAAGFIFPSLAAVIIAAQVDWVYSFGVVGALALVLWATLFFVRFPATEADDTNAASALSQFKRVLTPRVCLIAVGVCTYLMAQTTFLTWSPNYLQHTFGVSEKESAQAVGNYWGMSIFGLITAAIFVNKIPQRSLLMLVTVLASLITFTFMLASSAEWFLLTSYLFGLTTTCIYKIAISVGSQQLTSAPAVLVTFLLFSGNVGSTIAPMLSGWVVQLFGVQSAIIMTWVGYTFVALVFGFCLFLEKRELRAHA